MIYQFPNINHGKIELMRLAAAASPLSSTTKGYLICLSGTVIWSTTGILIRYLTETYHLPPLVLAVWRDLFVTLGLAAGIILLNPARLKVEREQWRFLLLYGFIVSVFNTSWTFSVALNGAAVATVLAYSAPAFTALLGWRLFDERLGLVKAAIITLSMLGCALVSGAHNPAVWSFNLLGIITGLLSGVLFAVYSLMGKKTSQYGLNSWSTLMYAFGIATFFLFVFNFASGLGSTDQSFNNLFWLGSSAAGWGVLLLLGLGPTIGGYGLYTLSLSFLPMSVASLIATLEPAFTTLLAYIFLAERMTLTQVVGSLMILGSVLVLRLLENRPDNVFRKKTR